jgi:toxin-antitoxin system PIN domain toxin
MTALLDVNVMIALFDPSHVHHEAAHRWFAKTKPKGWATCPITENGMVRVLSSPGYPLHGLLANDLIDRLRRFRRSGHHLFWPDDVSLTDEKRFDTAFIRGHRKLTDVYLLGLAEHHNGFLATFDLSIPTQALASKNASALHVIA